ncbi:MAG: 50S ribosomal protein L21 [Patescibacteria group bacterium]
MLTMFAVIKTGGKQYLVKEGDILKIEKLDVETGKPVEFEALLRAEEDGSNVEIGAPTLANAIAGEVIGHGRDKKISVVKYKPKVRYKKRRGHRQEFTKVKITKL